MNEPKEMLHLSRADLTPACGARIELDPTRDSSSPDCAGTAVCRICFLLQSHFIRSGAWR